LPIDIHVYLPILVYLCQYLLKWHRFFYKYLCFCHCKVLSSTKSNCCDFITKDEWLPIYLISIYWIIMFGDMLDDGVLWQAATKAKNSSWVQNASRSSVAPYRLNKLCFVHDIYGKFFQL